MQAAKWCWQNTWFILWLTLITLSSITKTRFVCLILSLIYPVDPALFVFLHLFIFPWILVISSFIVLNSRFSPLGFHFFFYSSDFFLSRTVFPSWYSYDIFPLWYQHSERGKASLTEMTCLCVHLHMCIYLSMNKQNTHLHAATMHIG